MRKLETGSRKSSRIPPRAKDDTGGLAKAVIGLVSMLGIALLLIVLLPRAPAPAPPCSVDPDFIALRSAGQTRWWWFFNQNTRQREATEPRLFTQDLRNDIYGLSQVGILNAVQVECANDALAGSP